MKIYSCNDHVSAPEVDVNVPYDRTREAQAEAEYLTAMKTHLRTTLGCTGANTGKILRVPFADGAAQYMLAEGRQSFLVHLELGDAYHNPDVQYLPKKEVLRRIQSAEAFAEAWAKRTSAIV